MHLGLIDKCETSCRHCFFSQVTSVKPSGQLLSRSEICELIDEMANYGCMELFIGGGEPFLRTDWQEIFSHANSRGVQLFVFTNGIHFSRKTIDFLNSLSNIGYVSVSIEGYSEETYAKTRQKKLWNEVDNGLRLLSEMSKFPTYVRYTATSNNISYFKELVKYVSDVGKGRIGIKVRPVLPSGTARKNQNLLVGYRDYLNFLVRVKKEIDEELEIDLSIYKDADPRKKPYRFSRKTIGVSRFIPLYTGFGGSGGYTSLYVDPYGRIQDCVMTYGAFESQGNDNVRFRGLLYQWHNSKPIKYKRNLPGNDECYKCAYYIWCRGGCRARAIHETGDENARDPWCFRDLEQSCSEEDLNELLKDLNDG